MSSSWGNGHATLWRALCHALARLGHHVTFFERDAPYYAAARDLTVLDRHTLRIYPTWESVREEARAALDGADAAIVTSYCPDSLAASALVLDSRAPVRAFYDLDAPITLAWLRAGRPVDYIGPEGLSRFDVVLSFAGSPAVAELTSLLGARRVFPLYGSVDPDAYAPAPARSLYRADLSYLGTFSADRQLALSSLFLEPARRSCGRRFVLGGSLYPHDFPWLNELHHVGHVAPKDHPAFYGSSTLTLNITRGPMATMGHCPSGRLFEAAACGAAVPVCYVVQPEPAGLCDAVFRALPLIRPEERVIIGLPDTVWFPEDALCRLGDHALSFLLFPVTHPERFDAVLTDDEDRVLEIQVKREGAASPWIWGALALRGSVLAALQELHAERGREDVYLGSLVNAYLARGGAAWAVRAGEAYVDVGTLDWYREAMRLLEGRNT